MSQGDHYVRNIDAGLLKYVREHAGVPAEKAGALVGGEANLAAIEGDRIYPTFDQARALADLYKCPFGCLFLSLDNLKAFDAETAAEKARDEQIARALERHPRPWKAAEWPGIIDANGQPFLVPLGTVRDEVDALALVVAAVNAWGQEADE